MGGLGIQDSSPMETDIGGKQNPLVTQTCPKKYKGHTICMLYVDLAKTLKI